jgi:hypothetical protein
MLIDDWKYKNFNMERHFLSCSSKSQAPYIGSHWKIVTKTEQNHNARITDAVMYMRRRKAGIGRTRRYDAMMEALVVVTAVA